MDILDVLSHLVDTSLVVPGDERQRYSLLETVRQYSADKLLAKEESDQVRRDHCAYYLALAGEGDRLVVPGEAQAEWLDLMEVDHDNVRAALAWAADSGERSLALRIAGSAALFWWQRGHHREARRWLGQVLDMGGHEPSGDLARAQSWGSSFALEVGDMSAAESLVSLASESAAALQEPDALARASMRRSDLAWGRGDSSEGVAAMRQAADVLRAGGGQGLEVPLANLALLSVMSGDRSTAVEAAQELRSLPEAPGFGDMFVRIVAGMSAFFDGDLNGAEKEMVLALEDVRDLDVPPIEMSLEIVLAWTLVLDDRPEEAERLALLASEIAENLEAVWAKADVATVLGMVALARAEYVEARRLLEAGLRIAWQAGLVDPTVYFMHAELLWREDAYRRAAEVLGVGRSAEASVSREVPSPHVVRVATVADALERQLGEHDFAMALARGEAMTAEAGFRHTLTSPPGRSYL